MSSPATNFQMTVNTTAASLGAAAALTAVVTAPILYGVRLSVPSGNSGDIYWQAGTTATTTGGTLLQKGQETTINRADFGPDDLGKLWLAATANGQTLTGAVL